MIYVHGLVLVHLPLNYPHVVIQLIAAMTPKISPKKHQKHQKQKPWLESGPLVDIVPVRLPSRESVRPYQNISEKRKMVGPKRR